MVRVRVRVRIRIRIRVRVRVRRNEIRRNETQPYKGMVMAARRAERDRKYWPIDEGRVFGCKIISDISSCA